MMKILLTAIGGDVAQAVATIIHEEFPDWRIFGCDIHDKHAGELFVDELYIAPRADSSDYLTWIQSLITEKKIDFCIPLSEAELIFFASNKIENISNATLIMPNFRAIEIGCDKLVTAQFLEAIGCPYPWTISATNCNYNTQFPCIFKPRRGAGSKRVFICNNMDEALFFEKIYSGGILQELLIPDDKEVTCAIYRTRRGDTIVIQLLRRLAGGSTVWAKVIDVPDIRLLCENLAEEMDLKGSINVQLRLTDHGPRIFEINPRFSSTVLIRHCMGFQDVIWSLKETLGTHIELFAPQEGLIGVKINKAIIYKY